MPEVRDGAKDVTVRLGRAAGSSRRTRRSSGGTWLSRQLTAYDAAGHALWKRGSLGRIGVVDVRDGRVVLPVFDDFTLGLRLTGTSFRVGCRQDRTSS